MDKKKQRKTQTDEGKATVQMEELETSNALQEAQQQQPKSPRQFVDSGRKKRTGYPQTSGLRWGDRGHCHALPCHHCHYRLNLKLKFGSSRFHTRVSRNCIDEVVITWCWGHCQFSVIKVAENSEETEGKGTSDCQVQETSDTGMKWRAGLPVAKKWVNENARVVTCGHLISLLLQKGPGNKPKDLFIKAKDFSECNFKKVRWGRRTNWKSALPQKRLQVWEIQTHSHHIQAWLSKQDHTNSKRLGGVSRPPKTTPAAGSCCCCCERPFRVWKRFFMGGEREETLALWAWRPGWCLPERADNRQDFWI